MTLLAGVDVADLLKIHGSGVRECLLQSSSDNLGGLALCVGDNPRAFVGVLVSLRMP